MLELALDPADLAKFLEEGPELLLLVLNPRNLFVLLDPLLPLVVLELLDLHVGLADILGSLPGPQVAFLGLVPPFYMSADCLLVQVLQGILGQLGVPVLMVFSRMFCRSRIRTMSPKMLTSSL